ncbi:MAG: SigE family RNA polymerase sigma factor [Nocardioidaceae bacterium]
MGRPTWEADFETFVVAAWPRLRRAAYLLTGNHQDAEDLVQTVLARTYVAWPRIKQDDVYAYARRSLVNANIDRSRRRRFTDVPVPPDGVLAGPSHTAADDRDEIVRLLQCLSPRERAVVVLRYYCDASVRQVAAELGISAGTVKSTASRSLEKLRVAGDGSHLPINEGRQ